jgi:hypothetical protein
VGSGTPAGEGVSEALEPAEMFGTKEVPVKEYKNKASVVHACEFDQQSTLSAVLLSLLKDTQERPKRATV